MFCEKCKKLIQGTVYKNEETGNAFCVVCYKGMQIFYRENYKKLHDKAESEIVKEFLDQ